MLLGSVLAEDCAQGKARTGIWGAVRTELSLLSVKRTHTVAIIATCRPDCDADRSVFGRWDKRTSASTHTASSSRRRSALVRFRLRTSRITISVAT